MIVKFQPLFKNYRYEVVQTETNEYYLVDMGVPFISWFIYLYSYFLPRRCYPISSETAKLLLDQEPASATSSAGYLGIGFASILTLFISRTDSSLSVSWGTNTKVILMGVILAVVLIIRSYYMIRARQTVLAAGAVIKADIRQLIYFKPIEPKVTLSILSLMLVLGGAVVGAVFIVLQPVVNVIYIGIFALTVLMYMTFSAFVFIPKRLFLLSKKIDK